MNDRNQVNEQAPLYGKRIMITRSKAQAKEFVRLVEGLGGEVYLFPVIKIVPPSDWALVDAAIQRLDKFDWILFTSTNGVDFFFRRLRELDVPVSRIRGKIACVGTKTEKALRKNGVAIDLIPEEFVGEALLSSLQNEVIPGQKVLLPRADIARKLLPDALQKIGCEVYEIDVYENIPAFENRDEAIRLLRSGEIQVITFTSSSTVTSFVSLLAGENLTELLKNVIIACIGPITAETAEQQGLHPDVTAEEYTIQGLLDALVDYIKE